MDPADLVAPVDPAELQLLGPAVDDLRDNLPHWWKTEGPGELPQLLEVLAAGVDRLSLRLERIYFNQTIATADLDGLRDIAYIWGIEQEAATLGLEMLRAYLRAVVAEDGSIRSLETTLLTLLYTPVNLVGIELIFPGGGGGFTFPADGSGLLMFQSAPATTRAEFVFPENGAGLQFPDQALYFNPDGSGIPFDLSGGTTFPNVPDLTFPSVGWLLIVETFAAYSFEVTVKSYLAFDRNAFKRAIERHRQAHTVWTYAEIHT